MGCWLYVLHGAQDGSFYVGITAHLRRRVKDHNSGRNKSTSAGRPWTLVHREKFADHASARAREVFLKSGAGRRYLKQRLQDMTSTIEG